MTLMQRRRALMGSKKESDNSVLWEEKNITFTGGNIQTEQAICSSDMDFTIAIDITLNTDPSSGNGSTYRLPRVLNNEGNTYTLALQKQFAADTQLTFTYMGSGQKIGSTAAGRKRFVIYHSAGSGKAEIQFRQNNESVDYNSVTKMHTSSSKFVVIGQSSGSNQLPPGTLNHGVIYGRVLSQAEIDAFLGV